MFTIVVTNNALNLFINRAFLASPTQNIVSDFGVGIGTTASAESDTALVTPVPIENTETVDDCSVVTGWSANGTNSVGQDTTKYREGSAALDLIKSDTSSVTCSAEKATPSLDFTSKDLWYMIYVDADLLALMASAGAVQVRFGSDSSNYYYKTYASSVFTGDSWHYLKFSSSTATGTVGSPVIAACDWTQVIFTTAIATSTAAAGEFVVDNLLLGSVEDYYKAVASVTLDELTYSVTVKSTLTTANSEGFDVTEWSLWNDDTTRKLLTRDVFSAITKTGSNQITAFTKFVFDQTC